MLTPEEDKEVVDAMTKIFLDAFKQAAGETGVPEGVVAQQVFGELDKRAEDSQRLKDVCAEIGGK